MAQAATVAFSEAKLSRCYSDALNRPNRGRRFIVTKEKPTDRKALSVATNGGGAYRTAMGRPLHGHVDSAESAAAANML